MKLWPRKDPPSYSTPPTSHFELHLHSISFGKQPLHHGSILRLQDPHQTCPFQPLGCGSAAHWYLFPRTIRPPREQSPVFQVSPAFLHHQNHHNDLHTDAVTMDAPNILLHNAGGNAGAAGSHNLGPSDDCGDDEREEEDHSTHPVHRHPKLQYHFPSRSVALPHYQRLLPTEISIYWTT